MDGSERGFTLLELMIGLALLALLLTLATPPLRELITANRAAVHAQTLMASLFLARTEAVKRNRRITLCKSADGATCTTAGDWSQGWVVFVDETPFGARDPAEEVVRIQQGLGDDFTLRNSNAGNWYAYRPDGSALSSGGLVTGTFRICPGSDSAELAYRVITNITGRPRVAKGIGSLSCP